VNDNSTSLNFALILFVLLVLCFVAWLAERLHFKPGRERRAARKAEEFDTQQASLAPQYRVADPEAARTAVIREALRQPLLAGVHRRTVSGDRGGVWPALVCSGAIPHTV